MYEHVAMSPDELPQQRLVAVRNLPACPPGFDARAPAPLQLQKRFQRIGKHGPAETLAAVEWGWSPMHGRFDTYVLERGKEYDLLWNRIAAGVVDQHTHHLLLASAARQDVDDRSSARWLLYAALDSERVSIELEPFHHINQVGLLSVADLRAVAVSVWGEACEPEDIPACAGLE